MSCPTREELAGYCNGRLAGAAAEAVASHLKTCAGCEAIFAALEREGDELLEQLRQPADHNGFLGEPECERAVARVKGGPGGRTGRKAGAAAPGQIREYQLLEKLGEGGMGVVYKALHTKLDKLVAIKLLPPGSANDPQRVALFEREMKAIGKLEDPHIVRAMDAGQVGDRHYLVMEYVEGINLSELLGRSGKLRIADACEMVRQAAMGLRAAEAFDLVHRDIKPSNLILNADGQLKILDLGLATFQKAADQDDEGGEVMGTPDYMAPEQALGSPTLDIRADIYSLGCTFYRLLTGEPPFSGPNYQTKVAKLMAHVNDPVPPIGQVRPDVPARLAAVLQRMLAKDPAQRFARPGQVAEELKPFCLGADLAGLFDRVRNVQVAAGETDRSRAITHAPPSPPPVRAAKPAPEPPLNAYHKWLGIPLAEQPPNHYRLLGIGLFEDDPEVIGAALARQAAHLRTYQLGKHVALCQQLLKEVHVAKSCLLDSGKKAAYDAKLRQGSQPEPPAAPPALPTEPDESLDPALATALAEAGRLRRPGRGPQWSGPRLPPKQVLVGAGGGAAGLLFLGIVIYWSTNYGTVKIELSDPAANVEVQVDGDRLDIGGLKEPLRLRVGEHGLQVTSGEFETFTKSFLIRRRGQQVVRVALIPKAASAAGQPTGTTSSSLIPHPSPLPTAPPPAVAPFDPKKAREREEASAKQLGVPVEMTNSIGMKLTLIPAGEFLMGSPDSDRHAGNDDRPQHLVRITRGFYLGVYEVTQAEYERVVGTNPSEFKAAGASAPVETVSWEDAVGFCRKLSELTEEKAAGRVYRLPTEAEWEYACRAGTTTQWSFGDDEATLAEHAWFAGNFGNTTHPVGQKKPNAWGLYDMLGNVWEWCADWYGGDYYGQSPSADPTGPTEGSYRVSRGGAWGNAAAYCCSAFRNNYEPGYRTHVRGVRVVCDIASKTDNGKRKAGAAQSSSALSTAPSSTPAYEPNAPAPAAAPFDAKKAREREEASAKQLGVPVEMTNSIGMKLTLIPAGEFLMGSPDSDRHATNGERPQHRVRITKSFYLGMYEVTQAEYQRVIGSNPSEFKAAGASAPVEMVSWEDAVGFCRKLSELPEEKAAGRVYRLPREAEWEYACRAGTTTGWSFGDDEATLAEHAWFYDNSGNTTHPVGQKKPNAWGLYDMHGNVCEWCADWYGGDYYGQSQNDDPAGPTGGSSRVRRGGNWGNIAAYCRSAYRDNNGPGYRAHILGLRVALVPAE